VVTSTLADLYDGLLLDLDGVVYIGADAVPGAVPALHLARAAGMAVGYVTNNASRTADRVAEHLRSLGLDVLAEHVTTSAQVAAAQVRKRWGAGTRVLAVGGPGVSAALAEQGLVAVRSAEQDPLAVVQGYGPEVGWADLAEVAFAVQRGAWWVATNTDLTVPTPRGVAPGNGSLVRAVRGSVDVDPVVAGKPEPVAFRTAASRLGAGHPLVVGDRLDTDIEGGRAAGMDTLLVLTGVHGPRDLLKAPANRRPTHLGSDLGALSLPALDREIAPDGSVARCGRAVVTVTDGTAVATAAGDPLELLWAALGVMWHAADDGTVLRLDEALGSVFA